MDIDFRWLVTSEWDPVYCQYVRVLQFRTFSCSKWGDWNNVREECAFAGPINTGNKITLSQPRGR